MQMKHNNLKFAFDRLRITQDHHTRRALIICGTFPTHLQTLLNVKVVISMDFKVCIMVI